MSQDFELEPSIVSIASEVRSWGSIVILGSGVSFGVGYPLTANLQSLLWKSIDSDENCLNRLRSTLNVKSGTAKKIIGNDECRTELGYELIAQNAPARMTFQKGFASLDQQKSSTTSAVHDGLADLLHRGHISKVISLNWDTALECAYRRRYGTPLPPELLVKPHGDAAEPKSHWVFPNESGLVPEQLLEELEALTSEKPTVLLIVGYSERDEEVVKTLIRPIEQRFKVFRISPGLVPPPDICANAETAIPILVKTLASVPEYSHLEVVTFEPNHDISNAVAGHKLGPADVEAVPKLPEVQQIVDQLERTNLVQIGGTSGCGKSISAYQAAYKFNNDGFEVHRPKVETLNESEIVAEVRRLRYPTVLLVDDAHVFTKNFHRLLSELSNERLKVILVTTQEAGFSGAEIRIASSRSVHVLADYFRQNQDRLLPKIRQLDSRVGDRRFDISLADRISEAEKSKSAWEFCFILRGGWQHADQKVRELYDRDRADVVLGIVAIRQISNLDFPIDRGLVTELAGQWGLEMRLCYGALSILREEKVVLGIDSLRCPHVRFADNVVTSVVAKSSDSEWLNWAKVLQQVLASSSTSLRGISWLLHALWRADLLKFIRKDSVLPDSTWKSILERCSQCEHGEMRRDALFALNASERWRSNWADDIIARKETLREWITEPCSDEFYALGTIINTLFNGDKQAASDIVSECDPNAIAERVNRINKNDLYGCGYYLGRLACAASAEFAVELTSQLDYEYLSQVLEETERQNIYALSTFLEGLASLDYATRKFDCPMNTLEVTRDLVTVLAKGLSTAPLQTFPEMHEIVWSVLGYYAHFLRQREPRPMQARVARKLVAQVDVGEIAKQISDAPRRDLETVAELLFFFRESNPSIASDVIGRLNFERLDETTEGLWANPHEFINLILAICLGDDNEPAKSWVTRHGFELKAFQAALISVAPEAAIEAIENGAHVEIDGHWQLDTIGLTALDNAEPRLVPKVLESHKAKISSWLSKLDPAYRDTLSEFLSLLARSSPESLKDIISSIDPQLAQKHWPDVVRSGSKGLKAVRAILSCITEDMPDLTLVRQKLQRRFPSRLKI